MKYVVKNMLPQPLPLETPERSLSIGGKNRTMLSDREFHSGRVQELIAARSMKLVREVEDEKTAEIPLEDLQEEIKEAVEDVEETGGDEEGDLQLLVHNDVQKDKADDCTPEDAGFQEENDGDSLTELPVLPDNKTEEPGRPAKKKKGKRSGNHN